MKLKDIVELDALGLSTRYIVIDELDVATGWTASGAGATVGLDGVNYRSGGGGLKLTVPVSIAGVATKNFGGLQNFLGNGLSDEIRFWLYVDIASRVSAATYQLIDNAGSPITATYTITGLVDGWNRISVAKSLFTNGATINWGAILTEKLNVTATAGGTVNVTIDMIRVMLGTTIGYTNGVWDESGAKADVVDGRLKFFDSGYWQYNDSDTNLSSMYRLDVASLSTVLLSVGNVRISGLNTSIGTLEVWNSDYVGKDRLVLFRPEYYYTSGIMDDISTAQGYQTGRLFGQMMDSFRQDFPQWSTAALKRHELEAGVGVADSGILSWNKRRARILAQYIVAHLPMNISGMKKVVESFVNSASVTHNPKTYSFAVQIVDPKGVPPNLSEIQNAIDKAKPAHLGYTLTYTFTTWGAMDAYSRPWSNTDGLYTWSSFEIS
jgi:hypothetical protein